MYNSDGAAMHWVNLRKVGGSVMLAVPPAILDMLKLHAGEAVGIEVEDGRLVVNPRRRSRHTLEELLAQSDYGAEPDAETREWENASPVGREPL
ncbi:MAG: AbrB/MazE/SpoVT family DNA-binding domain-containing protein [Caulobacteraceae bacterium]